MLASRYDQLATQDLHGVATFYLGLSIEGTYGARSMTGNQHQLIALPMLLIILLLPRL